MLSLDRIELRGCDGFYSINTLIRCDDSLQSIIEYREETLYTNRKWLLDKIATHGTLANVKIGDMSIIKVDVYNLVDKMLDYSSYPYIYHLNGGKDYNELIDIMERRVDVRAALLLGKSEHYDYDFDIVLDYIVNYGVDNCKVEYLEGSIGKLKTMNRVFTLFK